MILNSKTTRTAIKNLTYSPPIINDRSHLDWFLVLQLSVHALYVRGQTALFLSADVFHEDAVLAGALDDDIAGIVHLDLYTLMR